jgi:hypothetical protein
LEERGTASKSTPSEPDYCVDLVPLLRLDRPVVVFWPNGISDRISVTRVRSRLQLCCLAARYRAACSSMARGFRTTRRSAASMAEEDGGFRSRSWYVERW